MTALTILHIIDIALWCIIAVSSLYVVVFSLASLLPKRKLAYSNTPEPSTFLILIPAYKEDAVIRHAVEAILNQDYPQSYYQVAVISDHMHPDTNAWLSAQPITLHLPTFEKSSKAKALQYAIRQTPRYFDRVVILDADNVVRPDFLTALNHVCHTGYQAIQCHRTAKNADNAIAALDGLSEEINNSIFRKGHNRIGLSSALIGSGMCFTDNWFRANVDHLDSAVEDRELESHLLKQGIYIHYAETIHVMDEKVSSSDNFQRQRLRWMTGQVQALLRMMPYLPKAFLHGNINYIDKTLQQALIPRSILLVLLTFMSLLTLVFFTSWSLKWWIQLAVLCIALFIAIPAQLRSYALFKKVLLLPQLVWRMLKNLIKIDTHNKEFLHTTHGSNDD